MTELKDPAGTSTYYEYDLLGRRRLLYNDQGLEVRYDYDSFQPDIESICPDYGLKLCLNVTDRTVYFRDLYALSSWEAESESDIKIDIENGT